MKNKIIIVSWWFDPVHKWHVQYFQSAAKLWRVIVWLNSDDWLTRKKGKPFMTRLERKIILKEMKSISDVIAFNDDDWTACDAIRKINSFYSWSGNHLIFAKWWDRTAWNTPEQDVCKELEIEVVFGVGGEDKPQSSSWLLKNWKEKK